MADIIPHFSFYVMGRKRLDWNNATLKVALVDDTYTPNVDDDTWESGSDPYDSEISNGNGYTTGGVTVTGECTNSTTNDNTKFDISNPSWTASGGSIGPARYGVLYADNVESPDANPLLYIFDFSSNQTANDGASFTITIDTDGLYTVA